MGRKSEIVRVPIADWSGRDGGKVFKLTEWPAARAEKWALRLFLALKGTTAQVPETLAPYGMVAVAIRGINSFLASDADWSKLEPLLDEMMECVQIVRDPFATDVTGSPVATPIVSDDDIEEVRTRGWLRSEVLRIHTNFSLVEALLEWLATLKQPPSPESLTT